MRAGRRTSSPGRRRGLAAATAAPLRVSAVLAAAVASWAPPAAAQWVEPPGRGWVQLAVYHQDTREEFKPDGSTRPFFAGGHAVMTSVFLTAAAGVHPGVDVWLQAPVHALEFTDLAARRRKVGPGDARVYVRAGPELLGLAPFPVALRGGVKIPVGDFPVDAEIIPLTEGQTDWEMMLEVGHSFWPRPAWAMGWVGYRWRQTNEEIDREPGDEIFAWASAGWRAGRLTVKLAYETLLGGTPLLLGIPVETARREIHQVFPTLGWRAGPGDVELGARLPFAGQNLPAGPAFIVGYFIAWDLSGLRGG